MAECIHLIDPPSACGTCSPPAGAASSPELWGPRFTAAYHGVCTGCGDGISPGDEIRADGQDGYLCSDCGEDGT